MNRPTDLLNPYQLVVKHKLIHICVISTKKYYLEIGKTTEEPPSEIVLLKQNQNQLMVVGVLYNMYCVRSNTFIVRTSKNTLTNIKIL